MVPDEIDVMKLRKALEIIVCQLDIHIDICKANIGKTMKMNSDEKLRKREKDDLVIVKAEGKTYSDLLKEVKKSVKDTGDRLDAKGVRKTKEGNLVIIVDGGKQGAEKIKDSLSRLTNAEIIARGGTKKKIVHIMDMDEVTTKEELEEVLREEKCITDNDFRVLSIRPTFRGQNAFVELIDDNGKRLLDKGVIRLPSK